MDAKETMLVAETFYENVGVQTTLSASDLDAIFCELRSEKAVQTTLSGIELSETLSELRRDKKRLQQQLNRRNKRISIMADSLNRLKNPSFDLTAESNNFNQSPSPSELCENEIKNTDIATKDQCYSDTIGQVSSKSYCPFF